MIESPAVVVPIWMILSAAFGFITGEVCGDYRRHRSCLKQANEELRGRLEESAAESQPIQRALKEQRGVINDIHSRLLAVSKGLEKRSS
jgi:hypothetical protein